ncbi:MAG: DUF4430 domain-containing protein [Clostridia bacterium]|nr:DUF4430 domain-containing protein [Clostridia bacterium]
MKIVSLVTAIAISLTSTVFTSVSDYTDTIFSYEEPDDYTVCCSVVADNVSLGEIVPPTDIIIDGENCAEIFVQLLENNGFTPIYTGTTDEWFYLSAIEGIDTSSASVSKDAAAFLAEKDVEYCNEVMTEGTVSEFDFTDYSGWIFTVNGEIPSVGMCDYIPEYGDEITLSFTLYYGEDLQQ